MASSYSSLHAHVSSLTSPLHRNVPVPLIDVSGAMRLSSVVNWMASGVFDPPGLSSSQTGEKSRARAKNEVKPRASLLQELFGLMVVVFGGETFLCMCTGATPSWLVNPKTALLFCLIHTLQTRTPLRSYLPSRPTLPLELILALPDAIGRTLLLTQFSILPLLHPTPTSPSIPPTPSSLILVPFILAVPFPALIFTGTSFFSPRPTITTPAELRPRGWTTVDAWCPVVIPVLFLSLIGPVHGWNRGLGWGEGEAVVACMVVLWGIFTMRAVYNFGHKREQWEEMLGSRKDKVKTQ